MIKAIIISVVAGGFTTSLIEYLLRYNLIDLLVEKVKGLFKSAESDVATKFKNVEKKL